MIRAVLLIGLLAAGAIQCGGNTSSNQNCPSYVVVTDASTEALTTGVPGDNETCAQFCDVYHPQCEKIGDNEVKCRQPCK